MRILIYENFEHFMPTGLGWGLGFIELDHQVAIVRKSAVIVSDFPETDLIVYFDVPNEEAEILEIKKYKDRNPDCKIIGVVMFPKSNYHKYLGIIDFWCGLSYQHKHAENLFKEIGFNYYNIPLATDKNTFFPMPLKKEFDISFIGTFGEYGHGDRDEKYYLYPALEDKNLVSYYSGFSWEGNKILNTDPKDLNTVYNATKVNLNFHYDFEKQEVLDNPMSRVDLNGRLFDIALSGNFQLCDHPFVKNIFEGSVVVGTKENWMDLIHYYKDNEEKRERLAQISRDIVLKYHTWDKRMVLVLDILKES